MGEARLADAEARAALSGLGRELLDRGLAWGNSGNMSVKLEDSAMLITSTGSDLGRLDADDFTRVELKNGEWSGARKPSKEVPMHAAVYRRREDARAVIHASPFWITLAACSDNPIPSELFIESMYYEEKVAYVDYRHPGSRELGDAVYEAAGAAEVIVLRNHGVIVFDQSLREARMRLETVEMVCRMAITAQASGLSLRRLPAGIVNDFLDHGGYKPRMNRIEGGTVQ